MVGAHPSREPPLLTMFATGNPFARLRREPPIPPCPLPQSLNEIEGATNPACGARRNLRVTAVTVLDFFRPLRFPHFASSSPRREPPTLSSSRRGTPLKAQSSSTPPVPSHHSKNEGARIKNSELRIQEVGVGAYDDPLVGATIGRPFFARKKAPMVYRGDGGGLGVDEGVPRKRGTSFRGFPERGAGNPKSGVSRTECRVSDTFFILYYFFFLLYFFSVITTLSGRTSADLYAISLICATSFGRS